MLAVYVSGHGFGHATRTAEVLRVLRARAPKLKLVVNTVAPAFLFEGVVAPPLEVRPVVGDVGLAQRDALVIDEEGTVTAWRAFMATWDGRVAAEARWLAVAGARLVLGDVPPLALPILGDLARACFVFNDGESIPRLGSPVEAQHLDRHGRTRSLDLRALVVDQRAHATPFGAGDHDVADMERAALHQHGRDRTAAAVELRLDHGAFGGPFRIGLEIEDFSLQADHVQQFVEIGFLGGGNLDLERLAAE